MKRALHTLIATALVATALPAAAQERCTETLDTCMHEMVEHLRHRGWAGLDLDHDEKSETLTVVKVVADSPAARAGFRPGDRLVAVDGVRYSRANEAALKQVYKTLTPGKRVTWRVARDGRETELQVELAPMPEHVLTQWIGQHVLAHLDAEDEGTAKPDKTAKKP